jgi:DNA-binding beta-propeller fold protein YncE
MLKKRGLSVLLISSIRKKVSMKYQTLFKRTLGMSFIIALFMGCSAPAVQAPTLMSPTSIPTVEVTPFPTQTAKPTMEKIWETNGNPNAFDLPTELALDAQGNIYVIDGGNQRVQKFDQDGNFLLMWGSQGNGDGQFLFHVPPAHYGSLTIDKDGYVYVTDHFNRVQKFDSNGKFVMKFGETGYPNGEFYNLYGIAVDDQGNIYTTDWTKYEIQKFDGEGKFLQKWEVPSCQLGATSFPQNLVIDGQGQLYVTNDGGNCIQKFDTQGNLLQQWGGTGRGNGQFDKLLSLALDTHGNIYVTDNGNNRIQKFDPDGNFLVSYGPFDYPVGIAVDSEGYVYAVEIVLGRLQKLRLQ